MMKEPWNDSLILAPPVLTCRCDENFDLEDLLHVCREITRILTKQSPLHKEGAILSRFVYKFDRKFCNDIGYRNFKKVNTALRKYLNLNLLQEVENFISVLPSNDTQEVLLPSRQMFEYLLVRLQTFAKVMLRICICSKQAAILYFNRVKRGESHWMSLMPYAVLSRTWSMISVLLQHVCSWYNQLYQYLGKVQPKGLKFLPENYQLPADLKDWLELDNLDEFGRFEWSINRCIDVTPILGDVEDNDEFDIFKYAIEINETTDDITEVEDVMKTEVKTGSTLKQSTKSQKVDLGESISRESFKTISKSGSNEIDKLMLLSKNCETKKKHAAECVTSSNKLKQFVENEEKYRNDESEDSLTKHLSFMQWQALKANVLKLCDPLNKNRKIEKKFHKIWKERCTDLVE